MNGNNLLYSQAVISSFIPMNCCHYATYFTHFRNCYCRGIKKLIYKTYTSSWFIIKCTVKNFIVVIFLKKSVLMCINIIKSGWHGSLNTSLFVCVRRHPETAVAGLQKTQSHSELRESPHTLPAEEMRHTSSDCVHAIQTDISLRKA